MNRLKIGITNTSYGVYGFEGAIERIGHQGYDCIDYQGFVDISRFRGINLETSGILLKICCPLVRFRPPQPRKRTNFRLYLAKR